MDGCLDQCKRKCKPQNNPRDCGWRWESGSLKPYSTKWTDYDGCVGDCTPACRRQCRGMYNICEIHLKSLGLRLEVYLYF